ncbi:hypothetical protein SAMN05216388_101177 [Halorientalis persicus]|jgi:hypothetical protein|uniref:Uncharacterized protein n=1 Tax=Halorientalis persicus TaxID=1367881 RepID=A0A1H8NX08_9EURY|nr:hypothetical protein SAMN05216388_101177 [Halorientalis persicus]
MSASADALYMSALHHVTVDLDIERHTLRAGVSNG